MGLFEVWGTENQEMLKHAAKVMHLKEKPGMCQ
jgi:hypothetical protein